MPSPAAESEPEPSAPAETAEEAPPTQRGTLVAQSARALLGEEQLVVGDKSYRYDCSGLVMAAHARAGIPLLGSTRSMFALAGSSGALHYEKQPFAGDVVFFDNTYDRNRNGQRDDPLSHVAVVQSVDEDGTIQMVHKSNRGVLLFSMNLHRPGQHKDSAGKVLNDFLRSGSSSRTTDGPVLAGQLWRAFASFWALDDVAQSSRRTSYEPCRS